MGSDQAQQGQQEAQQVIPVAAGIPCRRHADLLDRCLRGDGGLGSLAFRADGDGLDGLVLGTQLLVSLDFLLIAVDKVVVANVHHLRLVLAVVVHRGIVGKQILVLLQLGVGNGNGRDQASGIGVHGEVEQFLSLGHFHDIALVDNANAVGNKPDNGQVMGDEEISRALLSLELLQQVQHLCTDGNVQSGDRLVSHYQFRLHDHRTGQTDSLALTAGEFVGIAGQMLRQQTDLVDHLFHLFHTVCFVLVQMEVVQALRNNVVHSGTLVQRSGGILEYHLDIPDHLPVQGVGNLAGNADTLIQDLTGSAGIDPNDGTANGGLAGAGLAYQRESLSLVDVEGRILHGSESLIALAKNNVNVLDRQQNLLAGFLVNGAMLGEMSGSCFQFCCFVSHSSMTSFKY